MESISRKAGMHHRVIGVGSYHKPPPFAERKEAAASRFRQDIGGVLSRWHGLQMAVQHEWGGRDSLQKSHQLADDIYSWFSYHPKATLYVEDLENLLHESMLLSFNTEIEDGSIDEVAEQLMILHEEYEQKYHCH